MELDTPRATKSAPLADQAYEIIKRLIATNQLIPGQMLTENQMAKSLGISRAPLREAFVRLAQDGFIEALPWKGVRVTPLTPKYIREIYEYRSALECLAARKAAPFLEDRTLDEMEAVLLEGRPGLLAGDPTLQHEMEIPFHGLYVNRCDNQLVQDALTRLRDHLARIRVFAGTMHEHILLSYEEHLSMLAAMRSKDPDLLEKAVRSHLANVADRLIQGLERSTDSALRLEHQPIRAKPI